MDWQELEKLWQRDELLIMERNPEAHDRLSLLMDERTDEGLAEAGCMIGQALGSPVLPAARRRVAEAVWRRLSDQAGPKHRQQVEELLANLEDDPWAVTYLKKLFRVLAGQQKLLDIADSSYVNEEG